jgi:class 3 adenylate cyclase
MAKLTASERRGLPDRAFAYIDAGGRRRLPIHDEAHVRNALARFDRVAFEDDAARDRARRRVLMAARRFGIVPVGFITGQIRSERGTPPAFPTGSVTFLLTDIERSTALLEHLGDGYAGLLKDVRAVVGDAIRGHGGHKVDAHGDEYFAVFDRPVPALEAAVDIQRSMGARAWPDDLECRVRIGIHGGRPTLTDAGYVGLSVHTVARVCFVAHGGQVVVTGQTKAALETAMPAGVRLRSLGRHRLSGLSQVVPLYQVQADGLVARFPRLRTG